MALGGSLPQINLGVQDETLVAAVAEWYRRILEIKLINSFPPKIIWRYGIYPKLFDKMSDIEFHEGMPFDVEDITNAFVIIDDLMNEVGDDKRTFKLVHERKPS
ncbi:hypothetical protein TNCV_5062211 [Trichonephila clavipes]|nr:hypothetical protein TNCV_5062211 [Trichonephila clavipes]